MGSGMATVEEEVQRLGGQIEEYRPRHSPVEGIAAGLAIFVGVFGLLSGLGAFGPREDRAKMLVGSAVVLAVGFWYRRSRAEKLWPRVVVCRDGLVGEYVGAVRSMDWPQVEQVRRLPGIRGAFSLIDVSQSCWYVGPLPRADELLRRVEEATLEVLLSGARAQFERSRRAEFGPLVVERDGLRCEGVLLPWGTFAGFEERPGLVSVLAGEDRTVFRRFECDRVPNLHVLRSLVEEVRVRRV